MPVEHGVIQLILNLELIGEALAFGTEAITTNADTHTTTVADGATDAGRAIFLKYTGTLDSACTITIGPDTIKRVQYIHNGTSGSQNILIKQGSGGGASVTIPAGTTKLVSLDGGGSGAIVTDVLAGGMNSGGLTYPSSDGSTGQFLKTNGSGVLSFATVDTQTFASGTKMLFQQTAAPTNWTKVTSGVDDRALRVVTGTVGTGGSVAMSTALATPAVSVGSISGNPGTNQTVAAGNLAVSMSGNIADHTLSTSEIPSHSHTIPIEAPSNTVTQGIGGANLGNFQVQNNRSTSNTGGGGGHGHNHNLSGSMSGAPSISGNVTAGNLAVGSSTATINVQYTDVIIATRD
jgi:hypothetical protein